MFLQKDHERNLYDMLGLLRYVKCWKFRGRDSNGEQRVPLQKGGNLNEQNTLSISSRWSLSLWEQRDNVKSEWNEITGTQIYSYFDADSDEKQSGKCNDDRDIREYLCRVRLRFYTQFLSKCMWNNSQYVHVELSLFRCEFPYFDHKSQCIQWIRWTCCQITCAGIWWTALNRCTEMGSKQFGGI